MRSGQTEKESGRPEAEKDSGQPEPKKNGGKSEAQKDGRESEAQRDSGWSEPQKEEGRPAPDYAACAAIKRYLSGLTSELNLRLLCDMETGVYGFPGKILWVENITAYHIEEKAAACGDIENDRRAEKLPGERTPEGRFSEERIPAEREENASEVFEEESFAGRIKYRLKQLKNNWMNLWKKKGR